MEDVLYLAPDSAKVIIFETIYVLKYFKFTAFQNI